MRVRLTENDVSPLTQEVNAWCEAHVEQDTLKTIEMQLGQIEGRLERLTNALIDRLIDQTTFNKRKEALYLERARLQEAVEAEQEKQPDPHRVQRFLELIKSLAATYIFAKPDEKRQIVQMTISNRTVAGKNILLEPANWLVAAEQALSVLIGAHYRPTSRTRHRMRDQHMEALIDGSRPDKWCSSAVVKPLASAPSIAL